MGDKKSSNFNKHRIRKGDFLIWKSWNSFLWFYPSDIKMENKLIKKFVPLWDMPFSSLKKDIILNREENTVLWVSISENVLIAMWWWNSRDDWGFLQGEAASTLDMRLAFWGVLYLWQVKAADKSASFELWMPVVLLISLLEDSVMCIYCSISNMESRPQNTAHYRNNGYMMLPVLIVLISSFAKQSSYLLRCSSSLTGNWIVRVVSYSCGISTFSQVKTWKWVVS